MALSISHVTFDAHRRHIKDESWSAELKNFEEEYRENVRAVFAFLMAATGNYHLSEELTQDAKGAAIATIC